MKRFWGLMVIVLLMQISFSYQVIDDEKCTCNSDEYDCQDAVDSGQCMTIELTDNVNYIEGTFLRLDNSNSYMTFDCKGNSLSGSKKGIHQLNYKKPEWAITAIGTEKIILKNCILRDLDYGIKLNNNKGFVLDNITIERVTFPLTSDYGTKSWFNRINIESSGEIIISNGNAETINQSRITNTINYESGILIDNPTNIALNGIEIINSSHCGISTENGEMMTLGNSTIENNYYGLCMANTEEVEITNTKLSENNVGMNIENKNENRKIQLRNLSIVLNSTEIIINALIWHPITTELFVNMDEENENTVIASSNYFSISNNEIDFIKNNSIIRIRLFACSNETTIYRSIIFSDTLGNTLQDQNLQNTSIECIRKEEAFIGELRINKSGTYVITEGQMETENIPTDENSTQDSYTQQKLLNDEIELMLYKNPWNMDIENGINVQTKKSNSLGAAIATFSMIIALVLIYRFNLK